MFYLKKINAFWIALLILLILPTLYGVWHSGFFVSDDGNWMVIRFSAFYQAFREGQFPVRFLDRLYFSYGYPVSNFLYPGFLYLGVPLKAIGFDPLQVIKILISFFMLGGGVFTYLWLRKIFSDVPSITGAVIYTYSPYHLYTLYKRGSVGELMTLSVVPFVLWMIERKSLFFSSVGIFVLLISHNTLALLFLILILGYSVIRKKFVWTIRPLVIGGLLSSFFTVPAITDLRFTNFSSTTISNPTENFASLELLGIGSFVILFLAILTVIFVFLKRRISDNVNLAIVSVIIAFVILFLTISWSAIIWDSVPSSWIQFPFRLLSVVLVLISFLSAYVVYSLFPKFRLISSLVIMSMIVFFSRSFLFPTNYSYHEVGYYDTNESLTTTHAEYMPIDVKVLKDSRPASWVELHEGEVTVSNITKKSNLISFDVNASTSGSVRVNRVYFPGWNYRIDKEKGKIPFVEDDGLMYIPVLRGEHTIEVSFDETPVRSVANFLSILGILILFISPSKKVINKIFK